GDRDRRALVRHEPPAASGRARRRLRVPRLVRASPRALHAGGRRADPAGPLAPDERGARGLRRPGRARAGGDRRHAHLRRRAPRADRRFRRAHPALSELLFRRGRAEDAPAAAPLMYASGPAAFDYVFGPKALALLESSFERDEGIFGCTNHEVGVLDRRVVAVGAFYDASMLRRRGPGTMRAIAREYGLG